MPVAGLSGSMTMRQRSFPALLALVALLTTMLAGEAAAQNGRVGGIVRDDKGEPIKGATVTVDNESIGSSFTATTDEKGRFSIIGLRPGQWRVTAQAPGFGAEGGDMAVKSGSPNPPVAFTMHRNGPAWNGAMAGIAARDLQAELTAADSLFNEKKWDEAVAAYRAIMVQVPALSVINLQIAAAFRSQKDYDAAITAYNALLTIDPNNEKAMVGIGMTNLERGDMKAAETTLLKAAEGRSAGREVLYSLGEVKSAESQTGEAVKWYEKANAADPSWGKPLYRLGMLAMNRGDKQNATRLLDKVIAVDPVSPESAMARVALDQLSK
jgi:Flp pilus assembly protein TadD